MPLIWRRHSPRLYKTVSSTSSDDDDTSYSSASRGSSQNPEPEQQPQLLEVDQNQDMDVLDSDSDISYGDYNLELSERARKKGEISRPRLQWEIMSIQYSRWCKRMERIGPEPETENLAMLEPSPGITLPLLKFQKEWLVWGLNQEASELRGGILADEMGMGKTIQAISLVVTARDMRTQSGASSGSSKGNNKCTLVICPLVALIQWEKEIEKHTVEGSVRVLVFHGAKRPKGEVDFSRYDFVLTTYSTVESDYRKYVMPPKVVCQYCNRGFFSIKTLNTHLRQFCGPNAQETSLHSKKQTKGKGKMKTKALTDPSDIHRISPLHSVRWERIIIDEAHVIKDRKSNTAKAVFHLESQYKWALSGTPLQNRVGELYSLIRYLQIFPYSYYICKDCDCCVLDFLPGHCANCDHASSRHFCWWNKYIATPIQEQEHHDRKYGQRAMLLLREKVLKSVLLRRTKSGRAADFAYPPKFVKLRRDSLNEVEEEFYVAMYTQSHTKFNSYVEAGTLMNHYAHLFDMLTRLRQALDHPYLVLYPSRPKACGLCHSEATETVITSCEHAFCKSCWEKHLATIGSPICPTCVTKLAVGPSRKPRRASKVKGFRSTSILNRLDLSNFKTSSKIEALKEEIRNMLEEDGSAKGIVFSQFTSFLDLIGYSLNKVGIKWVQLNGSMNIEERDKAIIAFADDADCKILLMSLKAGGVALNLVVASYVFLMDPWWNPAAEKQAQDRIHRIGQHKPIRVIRFVIEDTIEERILSLQAKKELVFDGTVGKSTEALARLTTEDLHFLFTT